MIYAAGFIDGEGCVTTTSRSFRLTISSTEKKILTWFKNTFGGNLNNQYLPANINHNMAWKWVLCRKKELNIFLRAVAPHLKLKNDQARAVMEFLDKYPNNGAGKKSPPQQLIDFVTTKNLLRTLKIDKHYPR